MLEEKVGIKPQIVKISDYWLRTSAVICVYKAKAGVVLDSYCSARPEYSQKMMRSSDTEHFGVLRSYSMNQVRRNMCRAIKKNGNSTS